MSSVNKAIIVGNLGADPEIKSFQNGNRIANIRIATSETWKDKQSGERKERTEWHSVTVQGDGLVGVVERFLKKGSKVYLEGKIQTRKWQDRDGQDRYSTEIVVGMGGALQMLDGAKGGQDDTPRSEGRDLSHRNQDGFGGNNGGARGGGGMGSPFPDDLDDNVPFVTACPSMEHRVS